MKKSLLFSLVPILLLSSCGETKIHKVTFEYNCSLSGKTNMVLEVKDGETVSKPIISRSDYVFDGWYKDNNTWQVPYDFNIPVKQDISIYAKWSEEEKELTSITILEKGPIYMDPSTVHVINISFSPYGTKETDVTWSSSNKEVATVDSSGVVSAIKSGTTTIKVTSVSKPNIFKSIDVIVRNEYMVNEEEFNEAIKEETFTNAHYEITNSGSSDVIIAEQDNNKAYFKTGDIETYTEKVDNTYYKYSKNDQGKWIKETDLLGFLPADRYGYVITLISYENLTYKDTTKSYDWSESSTFIDASISIKFYEKVLSEFSANINKPTVINAKVALKNIGTTEIILPIVE